MNVFVAPLPRPAGDTLMCLLPPAMVSFLLLNLATFRARPVERTGMESPCEGFGRRNCSVPVDPARGIEQQFGTTMKSSSTMAPQSSLDTRQLRAFVALARTNSFTAAGRELLLSQSAVCHSLKALEESVGCRLFDRVGKKVHLTLAGEQLLQHADKIFREMAVAREALRRFDTESKGRIRLSANTTVCTHLLPTVLHKFKLSLANYVVTMVPTNTNGSLDLLFQGQVDLALTMETGLDDRFLFDPLFCDEVVFLVSPRHTWARTRKAVAEEVAAQNYLLGVQQSHTYQLITQHFRRDKINLPRMTEQANPEVVKELVKLDMGVSIVAPWTVRDELRSGELVAVPLGRRKLRRKWGIVRWKNRPLTSAQETFVRTCREIGSSTVRESAQLVVH